MNNTARTNQNRGLNPWRGLLDLNFFDTRLPMTGNSLPAVNLSEKDNSYTVDVVASARQQ
jgi:hypothetical protein